MYTTKDVILLCWEMKREYIRRNCNYVSAKINRTAITMYNLAAYMIEQGEV